MLAKYIQLSLYDKIRYTNEEIKILPIHIQPIINDIIYKKHHRHTVKCMSYDTAWCIKKDFHVVADAIIQISSIIFALRRFIDKEVNENEKHTCVHIVKHIIVIFSSLKEGLREYGCIYPPFRIGTSLKKDDVITSAKFIMTYWLL